ncbi:MAG: DUF4242 domain-containing protein [Spirochaetota bacterium]|nr:DUF4242 domain-containing protein [Spirochaetota bacterium]
MPKYMIIHQKDPKFVSHHINNFCKTCAREKEASWMRVNYNLKEGKIYCLWEASDRETLINILNKHHLPSEEVVEVDEMTPDECYWDIHGDMED